VIRSDACHVSLELPAPGTLTYSGYTVDNAAPGATLTQDLFSNTHSAVVQSSEAGMAYLVNTAVTVHTVADILGSADRLWNSVAIGTANTNTNLAATGLSDGSYRLYTADAAGNLSLAASNTVVVDSTHLHSPPATPSTKTRALIRRCERLHWLATIAMGPSFGLV